MMSLHHNLSVLLGFLTGRAYLNIPTQVHHPAIISAQPNVNPMGLLFL